MADFVLQAPSETMTEKVIIDDPNPQCSSDASIEKIEATDVTVASDPASESPETVRRCHPFRLSSSLSLFLDVLIILWSRRMISIVKKEIFDDAVGTADPAPQSSDMAEIPDAATGGGPAPRSSNETIRDEAIVIQQRELHYLDFLRVALIKVVTLVAAVYGFVKNWAGLFRPIIDRGETMVIPLCKSYSRVPFALLRFADQKIDILTGKLSHLLPSSVKRAGLRVNSQLRLVRRIGLVAATMNLAKKLYAEHETTVKAAWRWAIDYIPLFWSSVRFFLCIFIFLSGKYNRAVMFLTAAAPRLPLVDVDRVRRLLDRRESTERIKNRR
ncbi:hypothetical protein ZIOFF_015351 [Zingiber officinale]|uniref:Uncharacterized protein n=1 Tax=Zingiber officinale TaxID=94328 RepID=A0A8J5HI39_ZINOF|nr:hypothetical protein ZIOFF_015351 [Zingiber officinale]